MKCTKAKEKVVLRAKISELCVIWPFPRLALARDRPYLLYALSDNDFKGKQANDIHCVYLQDD